MPSPDQRPDGATLTAAVRSFLPDDPLHGWQQQALDGALRGDALVVMASGSGKTLVYQIAARMLGGLTVVVSPTVSLQRDQLGRWREHGGHGAVLNATRGRRHERETLDAARLGALDLLLLAPEQLGRDPVIEALAATDVRLLVVDEAHCVSEWGHDFRPDYLQIAAARHRLGDPHLLALTATASRRLRQDVAERLDLRDPAVVVGELDRPEIWLGATVRATERDRDDAAAEATLAVDGAVLVYCQTRAGTHALAERLRDAGRDPAVYHAGLPARERDATADAFLRGDLDLVVATSAFGMGVDRPDVRAVVHAGPPPSLDAYYQEVGRAGRDGEPARAVLVHRAEDFALGRYLRGRGGPRPATLVAVLAALRDAGPDGGTRPALARAAGLSARTTASAVGELLQVGALAERPAGRLAWAGPQEPAAVVRRIADERERRRRTERSRVELVQTYADTDDCRRRLLLELLGEPRPDPCGRCDNCDAGTSRPVRRAAYRIGQLVRHADWGRGSVSHLEADRVTVLFDEVGYRTLALELVQEGDLLGAG